MEIRTAIARFGLPALFVLLWSTGFIGARLGLPHAGPLTFLSVRYVIAAALLAAIALAMRAPWPSRRSDVVHYVTAGLLVHAVYLGGVFTAISLGIEAGVSALIVSVQPLLVAALAGLLFGERVSARQWFGLVLGLVGVSLVVAQKLGGGLGATWGAVACIVALAAITAGTLYQKRHGAGMDLRTGTAIQFLACAVATAPLALHYEQFKIDWTIEFVIALAWPGWCWSCRSGPCRCFSS